MPIGFLCELIRSQSKSLKALHLGHLTPTYRGATSKDRVRFHYEDLGQALAMCEIMEDFRLELGSGARASVGSSSNMIKRNSSEICTEAMNGPWRKSLKVWILHPTQMKKCTDHFYSTCPFRCQQPSMMKCSHHSSRRRLRWNGSSFTEIS